MQNTKEVNIINTVFNKSDFENSNSWAFIEARKILTKIDNKIPNKGFVLFETGYGPSGLPHIGTFGEVVRTSFVRYAFQCIAPEIPTRLYCVSDDIDGLRKVPDNIPNKELVRSNIGKPLTAVPDPFATHQSYGHHMNARLRGFLDSFGFDYYFISATEKYKSGAFNETMAKVMIKYDDLMKLMLPTLGEERQATYSPFMPIDPDSGIVIDKGVVGVDKERNKVIYLDNKGEKKEISIFDGNCKLQWKIDFGARWHSLEVDYEIYGKDHQPNEKIYRAVCQILGSKPPVNFTYEMFLSDSGEKISKSKGNGIAVEDWLKYAPAESMALFMYQKPKTAKRLYFDVIPKAMDDYLIANNDFATQSNAEKLDNPIFHIHNGRVTKNNFNISYSLLLNLASACNPENEQVLWGFIAKYQEGLSPESSPLLAKMVKSAINYYNDFIKQNKQFRVPNDQEKLAIKALIAELEQYQNNNPSSISSDDLQNITFKIGREFDYEQKMRDWFLLLYQVLLGQNQGPRIGSFIALFGIKNFIKLANNAISNLK